MAKKSFRFAYENANFSIIAETEEEAVSKANSSLNHLLPENGIRIETGVRELHDFVVYFSQPEVSKDDIEEEEEI